LSKIEKVLGDAGLKFLKGFVLEKDINPSEIDHASIKNILIVVRHQMGDMLCAVPMMRSLRFFYPEAHISLVTKESTKFNEIFTGNNSPVDEVHLYEHGFENYLDLVKKLRERSIDLAVVPATVTFSATNHMLAYYSNAKIRVGVKSMDYLSNKVNYLLNVKNDFLWDTKKIHQIERNLDIIRQINIEASETMISLSVKPENEIYADEFFRENFPDSSRPVIGFHTGAAKTQNVWPHEKFAELAQMLYNKYNAYFYISEGPSDSGYVKEFISSLSRLNDMIKPVVNKRDLLDTAAIIKRLSLFVSNDTGIMHFAAGFDVPLVGLFGSTKAYQWGPLGDKKAAIQAKTEKIINLDVDTVYETCMALISV